MKTTRGVTIQHFSTEAYENHDVTHLHLWNTKETEKRSLRLIQYKCWPYNAKLAETAEGLITLWDEIETISRGKHPIVVTC